jgi:hypothetical protein
VAQSHLDKAAGACQRRRCPAPDLGDSEGSPSTAITVTRPRDRDTAGETAPTERGLRKSADIAAWSVDVPPPPADAGLLGLEQLELDHLLVAHLAVHVLAGELEVLVEALEEDHLGGEMLRAATPPYAGASNLNQLKPIGQVYASSSEEQR